MVLQGPTTICNAKPASTTHIHLQTHTKTKRKPIAFKEQKQTSQTHIQCNVNDVTVGQFLSRSLQLCDAFICEVPVKTNNKNPTLKPPEAPAITLENVSNQKPLGCKNKVRASILLQVLDFSFKNTIYPKCLSFYTVFRDKSQQVILISTNNGQL